MTRVNLEAVQKRVNQVIEQHFNMAAGCRPASVENHSDIFADLGGDSLDMIEIVMSLEEEFETEIDDDPAMLWRKPEDAAKYIHDRLYGSN
uniref:Acyl carrier protein n=1 Tax=Pseudomonas phage HRDY3 TaxID=3236930 RepID=A0AB39CER0_9VIRU